MGAWVDYFVPKDETVSSFCDLIESNSRHMWSWREDGPFLQPSYATTNYQWGGSALHWPMDDRDFLPYWAESGGTGGCCHSAKDPVEVAGWGHTFQLHVKARSPAQPVNETWRTIAETDGSVNLVAAAYTNGLVRRSGELFVSRCGAYADVTGAFMLKIEQGGHTDYLIAATETSTVCDALAAHTSYKWAPSEAGPWIKPHYHATVHTVAADSFFKGFDGSVRHSVWGGMEAIKMSLRRYEEPARPTLPNASAATWVTVMDVAGDYTVLDEVIVGGYLAPNGSQAVEPCAAFDAYGTDFVVRVTMGTWVDYFKPRTSGSDAALSLCDMLTSRSRHLWADSEDGDFMLPT